MASSVMVSIVRLRSGPLNYEMWRGHAIAARIKHQLCKLAQTCADKIYFKGNPASSIGQIAYNTIYIPSPPGSPTTDNAQM